MSRAPFRSLLVLAMCMAGAGSLTAQQQQAPATGRIVGTVVDAQSNQALSGTQVYIEGTSIGLLTDDNGRFVLLNVRPGTYTVSAQLIGHATGRRENVRVAAGETVNLDFRLTTAVLTLQGVVVAGVVDPIAGVKAPFSIATVSKENIATVPTTNSAAAAIQGKVAGASIVRNTGQPGTGVSVWLRTPTSIQGSNSPLYVVDGVIIGTSFGSTTVDIETLDIESIEVVKGAAASSLYGSRAAGGVIAITTSRGRDVALGQTRVRFRSELGRNSMPSEYPLATRHHYRMNEAGQFINTQGQPVTLFSQRAVATDRVLDKEYSTPLYTKENLDALFRAGQMMTTTAELTHNSAGTNFLASMSRYQEQGALVNNDGFVRHSLRVNLDHRLREDFSFAVSAFHSRGSRDELSGSPFFDILVFPPDYKLAVKDSTGQYVQQPDTTLNRESPLWRQASRDNRQWRARTQINGDVRFSPVNWLNFSGNLSYDRSDIHDQVYVPKGTRTSLTSLTFSNGQLDLDDEYTDTYNGAVRANILRNFGKLTTRTTVQATFEKEVNTEVNTQGTDFSVKDVPDLSWAQTKSISSSKTDVRSNGVFVQSGLEFDNRFILDGLVRRDGSSLFGANERWQTYWRAAGAYRMAQESWWPFEQINEFKLRAARGTAGNRPGFSAQYETWSVNSTTGLPSKNQLGNKNLKPEFTTENEFGLDMIFFNKYQLQLSYARQVTDDQIISLTVPSMTGYSTQWANAGQMTGHTYEATLEAQIVNQPNFSWNTTFVADRSRSEITEWSRSCIGSSANLGVICKGANLGEMHGARYIRSLDELPAKLRPIADEFQINDDGYVVWVGKGNSYTEGFSKNLWGTTKSGTGYPNALAWGHPIVQTDSTGNFAKVEIGNSMPDFQLGWINNFNYRGLAVQAHLHSQIGGHTYNNTRRNMYTNLRHADLDQSGRPQELKKPIDYYMHSVTGLASGTNFVNSHFVEDATYLKLRSLSVQYRFNKNQLQKLGLGRTASGLSLGLIGRNLFLLTNYTGFDPEIGGIDFRVDQWQYPQTRSLTGVVEITF